MSTIGQSDTTLSDILATALRNQVAITATTMPNDMTPLAKTRLLLGLAMYVGASSAVRNGRACDAVSLATAGDDLLDASQLIEPSIPRR